MHIDAAVESAGPRLLRTLQSLVHFPSLSGREQGAQRAIATEYEATGLETTIVPSTREKLAHHPAFSDDGVAFRDRLNVVGRWRGTGGGRSLILNGHMDVVPTGDLALWTHDPWTGDTVGDRLYGRGSCDMKAGLTAALYAVRALKSIGFQPAGDVILESVIGEESGGIGTLTTIVEGYRADGCIIMEPTELALCPVQSGALTFRITLEGRAAHACMKPSGVSAIEAFLPIFALIEQLNRDRHAAHRHPLYADPTNIAPISIGTVRAGSWHSTVPDSLVAEGRFGLFPGEDAADGRALLAYALRAHAEQDPWLRMHPPRLEWFEGQFESGETPSDAPIVETVGQCHAAVAGNRPAIRGITFGADLRLFTRHADIPTVMYGPGSAAVAHTTDEFVPVSELMTCTKTLARTIVEWCGGSVGATRSPASRN
ncbi:MAG TPA: ArgE/DapE family deacylase [Gemmatimonadaceae bacterium]|nr:ArgE/DapE family deacylase [Gemmatimonadaceae bacterium]